MQGLTQANIQIKKLTWLVLGVCFVLLYSCPVKKYLLLTFGKARAAETEGREFQKSGSSHCEKIVYLHREPAVLLVVASGRELRPVMPPAFTFFTTPIFSDVDNHHLETADRALLARDGGPPLYLELMRLRV